MEKRETIEFVKDFACKYIKLVIGLFTISLGIILLLYSDLGMNPWNVFQQGISIHTPLTLGQASQVVGFVIIITCLFFKIYPGVGTVTNMIIMGIFVDILNGSGIFFTPQSFLFKIMMCLLAVGCTSMGTYLYMSQSIGAGPRDSLMLVICQNTKFKIGVVRNSIEITVLIIGFILGGKVGIGTVIMSLLTGPGIAFSFKLFNSNPKQLKQDNLVETYLKFKHVLTDNADQNV